MGSTLKGKNLLLWGANSCLNELTPLRQETKMKQLAQGS